MLANHYDVQNDPTVHNDPDSVMFLEDYTCSGLDFTIAYTFARCGAISSRMTTYCGAKMHGHDKFHWESGLIEEFGEDIGTLLWQRAERLGVALEEFFIKLNNHPLADQMKEAP